MKKITKLTDEQIAGINKECEKKGLYDQGVFREPSGIPVKIKEHVIYSRYDSGGFSGGTCWNDSNPQPYQREAPEDHMKVLDMVLSILKPDISYLEYRMISGLIHDNTETQYEYYGNSTDWKVEYIKLSELYEALEKL